VWGARGSELGQGGVGKKRWEEGKPWRPDNGGEHAASVVHHAGGGGGCFWRGSAGAVVGSDEGGGGALTISGAEGGHREVAHARAREAGVAASAIWPVEDYREEPACQREKMGRTG
jgi:hypothetical protein